MIKSVIALALVCVLLPAPASHAKRGVYVRNSELIAKRFKTLESYYAWRKSHPAGGRHHSSNRTVVRSDRSKDHRRDVGARPLGVKAPILYPKVTGSTVLDAAGRYDRFDSTTCGGNYEDYASYRDH